MKNEVIPFHTLPEDEFFLLERIETADTENFKGYHRHHFYEILWFTHSEGNEQHSIDFVDYTISANEVYILTPNQVHTMQIGKKKGFLIAVSSDFFDRFFQLSKVLLVNPYFFVKTLSQEVSLLLRDLMALIEKEYSGAKRQHLLEAYLTAFLIHVITNIQQPDAKDNVTGKVLRLIKDHFADQKEVSFYANAINLSPRRTNEIMVATTGMTVKQLLSNRLIIEAKRLIAFDTLSSKEIAYVLGYNDPAYFSRVFKRKTGKTPEEFRKLKL